MRRIALLIGLTLAAQVHASSIDKEPIRRQMRANLPKFAACYEKALAKDPKLEGRVSARFTLDKDGRVIEIKATTSAPMADVGHCIAKVIVKIRFPAYGGQVVITYPFNFAPDVSR